MKIFPGSITFHRPTISISLGYDNKWKSTCTGLNSFGSSSKNLGLGRDRGTKESIKKQETNIIRGYKGKWHQPWPGPVEGEQIWPGVPSYGYKQNVICNAMQCSKIAINAENEACNVLESRDGLYKPQAGTRAVLGNRSLTIYLAMSYGQMD